MPLNKTKEGEDYITTLHTLDITRHPPFLQNGGVGDGSCYFLYLSFALEIKLRALYITGKCYTTELYP